MSTHADVGAYLLGALDEAEMTAFEEHLAGCERCGRELDELSGLLPVLEELRGDGVGAGPGAGGFAARVADGTAFAGPPSGAGLLDRLLGEVAGERRRRRRRRLVAVAAASVLVVGGPAVAVVATSDSGGHSGVEGIATPRHSASNPATGASALVGVSDKGWGSAVDLRLSGVRGPLTCSLVAVGRDRTAQTVATWSVPNAGYGTEAQPTPLTVHGATGLHRDQISHFEVKAADGTLLVSVPLRP
ncbi:zf-HC2 domain-containing protein [Streptomyces sp. V4-01]|uniref:Zf-HC2 domain-containing protein n=1 Tax=Actinacidiphila polyblastidii TaxID=3110430 RepID=A0ABU7PEI4_9ACTN|nr:zf-HC2 domain-containing protein [Streptomyces sp. V4-01]